MQGIWARKSIAALEAEAEEPEVQALTTHNGVPLKRTLSALNLAALGVGAIIGAGIFVLTGHAAAANAGPAITLSFVLGAFACAFAGLCYAEMASTVPIAGSAYTYAYATMGELIAWIIGWDLILEYALGAVTVAIGWSGYVVSFLKNIGIVIPPAFSGSPFAYDAAERMWQTTGALINFPAMVVIAGISALLVVGVHETARANGVIVAIKLVIIVVFIIAAAPFVSFAHWVTASNPDGNFIPPNLGPGQFGFSGVVRGAAVVFFAYIGFDAVSTAAQEAKNPEARHADRHSRIFGVVHGALRRGGLRVDRHRALRPAQRTRPNRYRHRCGRAGGALTDPQARHYLRPDVGHFGHAAGTAADLLFDGARRPAAACGGEGAQPISHALYHHDRHRSDRDGARWPVANRSRRRTRQHRHAVRFRHRLRWVLVLRIKEPALARPFRTPAVYVVAPLGAASSLFLMSGLPLDTWLRFGGWLVVGLLIYFLYGIRHSRNQMPTPA